MKGFSRVGRNDIEAPVVLERLNELVDRIRMGGIDSDATAEEAIIWIVTGRLLAEQRADPLRAKAA
jgi:hypothetical protein